MNTLNINHKLQLVTIIPLVLALTAVLLSSNILYRSLTENTTEAFRTSITEHRKTELKNYLSIAQGAINQIKRKENLSEQEKMDQVKIVLSNMRFGSDGYYFAYDFEGNSLVLPGQEWRIGKNWIEMEDINGVKVIQGLIDNAKNGGGYLNYIFNQPSKDGLEGRKFAYSETIEPWGWMIGTGVYIDDIELQTQNLADVISTYTNKNAVTTFLIGIFSVFSVFIAGLFLRFSERRVANKKLRELNERIFQTQEEERKRVSRELHDGISQSVAAVKFSVESAQLMLSSTQGTNQELDYALSLIQKTMIDIRSISHQLHPRILEEYGLGAALDELGREFETRTGVKVVVTRLMIRNIMSTELKTTLYRIAQESLANIERHANASHVTIKLELQKMLHLEIADNGQGMLDSTKLSKDGIGLRNMKERLNYYQGKLKIRTSSNGTIITALIPKNQLYYNADK